MGVEGLQGPLRETVHRLPAWSEKSSPQRSWSPGALRKGGPCWQSSPSKSPTPTGAGPSYASVPAKSSEARHPGLA